MKKRKTGVINLNTLTRLGRRVYDAAARGSYKYTKALEYRRVWLVNKPWIVTVSGVVIEHRSRATARKMAKAALEAALPKPKRAR